MDEDPLIFLQICSKKLDSSHEYKRIFLMLYRRCVGHSLHAKIASDVNDVSSIPEHGEEKWFD
jgi:hypothetical protein